MPGPGEVCGAFTALLPPVTDATGLLAERDRLSRLAEELGGRLRALARAGTPAGTAPATPPVWDAPPLSTRPPTAPPPTARIGRFTWDPVTGAVAVDEAVRALLGPVAGPPPETEEALLRGLAGPDARRLAAVLRDAAHGKPPAEPLPVRVAGGSLRLVDLWPPDGSRLVHGLIVDGGSMAGQAADPLPQGVFCVDRLGYVGYTNPRAEELLGVAPGGLTGRCLWEAVPWLAQPVCEDHLRTALLSPDPVHFHAERPPAPDGEGTGGDWLAFSVHPGREVLTCTVVPSNRVAGSPAGPATAVPDAPPGAPAADPAHSPAPAPVPAPAAPLYRPIVLAIALSEAATARQVSAVVMQELLPAFGGRRLAIYLLQDRHLYLAWEAGFPEGFLDQFDGVGLDVRLPGVETLTTGKPMFFDSMRELAAAYPGIPLDTMDGARAFLPLIASGRRVGSCILGFDRERRFSTEERTVLTALAGLIAHAMEKAQRYETEAALARGLQQALLPRRLSAHPEVETAGRYLPGTQGMDVGGDWYDAVEAGDGVALVIGDVQGHGVQAAATMGQLRSAVRAFALDDRPPDEVLQGTNRLLIDLDPGQFASCCYVRLDPATGRARIARAGHPPPLLRHPDGRTRRLDTPAGVVLGVLGDARYPVEEVTMEPGAILALYTDGLVERPGLDIDDGIGALRIALARGGTPASRPGTRWLAAVADRLTAATRHTADRPDDIALLLAARRTEDRPRP